MSLASNGVQNPEGSKIESKENGFDENGDRDQYNKLLDLGLVEQVAQKLDAIYKEGLVKHEELDDRAFDALKEFECEGACAVLQQFKDSNLSHVQNKSAFLCGVMKTYRQRQKAIAEGRLQPTPHGHPDEAKIKELLNRTKYNLDVTTGQRKYGGPPPKSVSDKEQPAVGAEVFIGKIPRDMFEDELVPLFEKCGLVWDFRLMMDPMTGQNRGYAFLSFVELSAARKCVEMYDRFEIRSKRELHVTISQPNNRLFVGSIPKTKTKQEILDEFSKHTTGLTDVILYYQVEEKNKSSGLQKNRGFCFLEYETHQAASQARRRLLSGRVKAWNNLIVTVDWADPINTPADDIMDKVKVLYVKNLATCVSEDIVSQTFAAFGEIEKVKKLKGGSWDYAFVHFKNRDEARSAMTELNGFNLEGQCIEICLAKPQDKKLKEKKLERQMQKQMAMSGGFGFGKQGMMPGMPRFPGPPSWMNGAGGYPYGAPGGYNGPANSGYGNGNEQWNGFTGYNGGYAAPMEPYMNGYGVRGPSARGGYYNSRGGHQSSGNRGGPKRGYNKGSKQHKNKNSQHQNNTQQNQQ